MQRNMKSFRNILKRLAELEKKTDKTVYTVEYENGAKETLKWGELMCYCVMKNHQLYKEELFTITKIYCKPNTEQYLQIPFAVLSLDNEPLPQVIFE